MRRTHVLACVATAALAAAPAAAQTPLTPRALGMGGAYIGVARGQESLFQNPANLGLPNSPHWSVAVPQISFGVQTRGIEPSDVWDLRDFGSLSDAERADILADVPPGGTNLDLDVQVPIFALQVGRFAVGAGYALVGDHSVNRSLVDLVLTGFEPAKLPQYNVENTGGSRAEFFDVRAAYGHRIGPVSLGATGHWFLPRTLVRSAFVEVDTIRNGSGVPEDVQVTYAGVRTEGGSGFGMDLGAAVQPMPGLTLGVALDNVVNTMKWDDDLRLRTVVLDRDDYENGDAEQILNEYEENEVAYQGSSDPQIAALADRLLADRDVGLPMTLRVGAAYEAGRGATVAASYQSALEDSPLTGLWENQLSVGWQQKIPVVTLRAGISTDLDSGNMLTGGLSLGPIQLGIGRLHTGSGDDKTNGWVATFAFSQRSDSTMP